MKKCFRKNYNADPEGSLEAMDHDELVELAIEKGITHLCKSWPTATVIRKIREI